jgi:hypoxanthine phosphoribosyltransferase
VIYSAEDIAERVRVLGREITAAYEGEDDLLCLGLLKGSFVFLADLIRSVQIPVQVDFLRAASYRDGTRSVGEVRLLYDCEVSLEGRSVVVVEDIIDGGRTLEKVLPVLEARRPKTLEVCALLHKRITVLSREVRWVGFDAPAEFLVGYGLDFGERFRHLPYIASLGMDAK